MSREYGTHAHFMTPLLILCALNFIASMDGTMIYTTMTPIASAFSESQLTTRMITFYLLTCASFQPVYGKTSDILGRWPLVIVSQVLMIMGLSVSSLASSIEVLSMGRAVTGMGAAGIYTLTAITIYDNLPLSERSLFLSYQNIVCSVASMFAGPLAGFLIVYANWRSTFIIPLPCLIITTLLSLRFRPKKADHIPDDEDILKVHNLKRIDYGGIISLNVFIISVNYVLSEYKSSSSSISATSAEGTYTTAAITTTILSAICFMLIENHVACERLIDPELLKGEIGLLGFINGVNSLGLNIVLFITPLYLQIVQNVSLTRIGFYTSFCVISISCGSTSIGFLIRRYKRDETHTMNVGIISTMGSLIILMIGALVIYSVISVIPPVNESFSWKIWFIIGLVIAGFGGGGFNVAIAVYTTGKVGETGQASAHTVLSLIKSLGGTFGLSLSCALYNRNVINGLETYFDNTTEDQTLVKELIENSLNIKTLPTEYIEDVYGLYRDSLLSSFSPFIVLSIIGVGCTAIMIPNCLKRSHIQLPTLE